MALDLVVSDLLSEDLLRFVISVLVLLEPEDLVIADAQEVVKPLFLCSGCSLLLTVVAQ